MASQGAQLGNKRDRRRGAAGRAAALRRAPSDSDCSGETASLSADSADRAPRPLPSTTRSTKSRSSRRRGSEWEVLEGLKDGQRFEKRPEVYNGYLHKKRKWPLKGWHKRFFVIDGGILVYARSPSDVARGRLHGSVDVGLSVISAKQRRRRIDIDADEFIYHLRAKTPDVFRTWLLVLKAHRLYRQHLLTFGARESAPKIHVPLDEMPPTDNSRTSQSSETFSTITSDKGLASSEIRFLSSTMNESYTALNHSWSRDSFSPTNEVKHSLYNHDQLMQLRNVFVQNKFNSFLTEPVDRRNCSSAHEIQLNAADKDVCSLQIDDQYVYNLPTIVHSEVSQKNRRGHTKPELFDYGSSSQSREDSEHHYMKKSKKCTNLVRYKNSKDEPRLNKPLSKCMLLRKCHSKASKDSFTSTTLVKLSKSIKSLGDSQAQVIVAEPKRPPNDDLTSIAECDKITEKLLVTIFGKNRNTKNDHAFVLSFVKQAVREIYDVKLNQSVHPIKQLFKCLLQYWLLNTSVPSYRDAMQHSQSMSIPSMKHFTKDANMSGVIFDCPTKGTQFYGTSETAKEAHVKESKSDACDYYDKERRIQELETLMKNTVYTCEIPRDGQMNNERDTITRDLLNQIRNSNYSTSDSFNTTLKMSSSSSDLTQLEETLHNLMTDYTVPPAVAKDLLNAYLAMLLTESNDHSSTTGPGEISRLIVDSFGRPDRNRRRLNDVSVAMTQEAVLMKSQSTQNIKWRNLDLKAGPSMVQFVDTAEQCVPLDAGFDLIEKITAVLTKVYKASEEDKIHNINSPFQFNPIEYKYDLEPIAEKDNKYTESDDIFTLDLCQYNLHDISISKGPNSKGFVGITIVLREKALDEEIKRSHTASSEILPAPHPSVTDGMSKLSILQPRNKGSTTQLNNVDTLYVAEKSDIQPFISSNEQSKIHLNPSIHSHDCSFQSSNNFKPDCPNPNYNEFETKYYVSDNEDPKQCYVLRQKCLETSKMAKKVQMKHVTDLIAKGDMAQQKELLAKSNPKSINVKLILLLLENLTLLSQNVPSMHKDVEHLYVKLKKKYDNLESSNDSHRLGFLSQIYKSKVVTYDDTVVALEDNIAKNSSYFECKDAQVSTEPDDQVADKSLMAYAIMADKTTCVEAEASYCVETSKDPFIDEPVLNIESLSDEELSKVEPIQVYKSKIALLDTTNSDPSMRESPESLEKAISIQRWSVSKKNTVADTKMVNAASTKFKLPEKKIKKIPATCQGFMPAKNASKPKRMIQSRPTSVPYTKKVNQVSKSSKVRESLIHDMSKYGWCKIAHSPHSRIKEKQMAQRNIAVYEALFNRRASQTISRSGSQLVMPMVSLIVPKISSDDVKAIYRRKSEPSHCSGLVSPSSAVRGPQAGFVSGTPGGRLASWIIESGGPLESASKDLGQAQLSVQQLQRLLDALELQQQVHHDTDVSLEGASPNVKKDRRKFGLRKKKSNSKCASVELAPPQFDPSSSHMALSAITAPPSPGGGICSVPNSAASLPIACAAARPQSLPGAEALGGAGPASLSSLTPDHQLREDFTVLAKDLVANLKSIVGTLVCERGRLRAAMDAADATTASPGGAVVAALRTNLSSALQQNSELRSRLSRIHDASDLAEISSVGHNSDPQVSKLLQQSMSYSSSGVSASEFFDAEEHDPPADAGSIAADEAGVIELDGDSSSEVGSLSSEEGSASSDNSDVLSAEPVTLRVNENGMGSSTESRAGWARRKTLPCPRPTPGGPSLWNLLYKNIGKDLSQISMPVTINEPLNMLQRLCEELEYSELLDSASECSAPLERTALVAAFAVSTYASSAHRAASKPFNPLLAETYECVRDDRAFRFVSEQVSHHPPVSACHAESPRWCFWQEARIKTKFWGKSMEFQPAGRVHVRLRTTGDHYSWNKVTTCVHNLFGGQRWVDQYGDMLLTCHGTDISAKLNFVKASPWSTSRHEVRGAVTQASSGARLRLQGRWSEALHAGEPPAARCLWRPGAMPPEHELYYGFTRFAMELNELEPGMKELLPHTDTRLRPDQRALEEGDVEGAEQFKHRLEQSQRERRHGSPEHTPAWFRKSQEGGEEIWVFNGEYWKAREAGFPDNAAPRIW